MEAKENRQKINRIPIVEKNNDWVVKPLPNKVYVEPDFGETETSFGFLLNKGSRLGIPNCGWILCLGKEVVGLEVGDYVVFNDLQARGFWASGVAHIPLNPDQICAIVLDYKR